MLYLQDGDRFIVVASKGGMNHHPAWFHNLVAHPDVSVQVGDQVRGMRARVADDMERAALWPKLNEMYPNYDTYQGWTERVIPVVILETRQG